MKKEKRPMSVWEAIGIIVLLAAIFLFLPMPWSILVIVAVLVLAVRRYQ